MKVEVIRAANLSEVCPFPKHIVGRIRIRMDGSIREGEVIRRGFLFEFLHRMFAGYYLEMGSRDLYQRRVASFS